MTVSDCNVKFPSSSLDGFSPPPHSHIKTPYTIRYLHIIIPECRIDLYRKGKRRQASDSALHNHFCLPAVAVLPATQIPTPTGIAASTYPTLHVRIAIGRSSMSCGQIRGEIAIGVDAGQQPAQWPGSFHPCASITVKSTLKYPHTISGTHTNICSSRCGVSRCSDKHLLAQRRPANCQAGDALASPSSWEPLGQSTAIDSLQR